MNLGKTFEFGDIVLAHKNFQMELVLKKDPFLFYFIEEKI